jgi:accessory sec system translocase secA2
LDYYKLRKINKILKKVNSWKDRISQLTDQELQDKTGEFRERLAQGATLDDILPEAFAVAREADKRVLGMFPYDVQVMGGIVLHQGNVAEMNTGEGKTLTATMPVYLNALEGKGVMVITTNNYLATRDAEEMGQVYRFLGLTIGVPLKVSEDEEILPEVKREIYKSDVVYTTNTSLGFDYLTENLTASVDGQFLADFNYAIVDEIDSVLLDSAQTPLIISGSPRVQSNLYGIIDTLIKTFKEGEDFKVDEDKKRVWLTKKGAQSAESFLGIKNLYDPEHRDLVRHISLALQANKNFIRDKDYVIHPNKRGVKEVVLLDQATGRLMEMTRLQGGLHQAIEAKEGLKLTQETRAMASITYQNLFKMFRKLGGMTGTGKVAEAEFLDTYAMSVIKIPTNRKKIRQDLPDQIYLTLPEKVFASLEYIKEVHAKGNPVLVFVGSVEMSTLYSNLLLREGIAHNLLNANNAPREAQIISESGQKGAVTVATSMAGRGTDIKLGPGVAELGGLVVVGTERMMNQRIDLQIRGRSGRQGDPGRTKFFVSLEDDLMKNWGPDWIQETYHDYDVDRRIDATKALTKRKYRNLVERAQNASESSGQASRRMTLEFAESMNIQRDLVYKERDRLIKKEGRLDDIVEQVVRDVFAQVSKNKDYEEPIAFYRYILDNVSYQVDLLKNHQSFRSNKMKENFLWEIAQDELETKYKILGTDEVVAQFQRMAILKAIDENWVEQVDYLQQLRTALTGQYTNQKNPLVEFFQEAYQSFERMKFLSKEQMIRNLLLSRVEINKKGEIVLHFP